MELCRVEPSDRIIDIGAGTGGALAVFNSTNEITAVDLTDWENPPANVTFVQADARDLPFPDKSFDVAFSNSMLQYLPRSDQARTALEIRRVAARYFVQTPNYWFPIEPHYHFPFFQFLPRSVRKALNAKFSLGWREKGHWEDVELLSASRLQSLFPDAEIHRERVGGLTKSLMAVR